MIWQRVRECAVILLSGGPRLQMFQWTMDWDSFELKVCQEFAKKTKQKTIATVWRICRLTFRYIIIDATGQLKTVWKRGERPRALNFFELNTATNVQKELAWTAQFSSFVCSKLSTSKWVHFSQNRVCMSAECTLCIPVAPGYPPTLRHSLLHQRHFDQNASVHPKKEAHLARSRFLLVYYKKLLER